MSFPVWPLVLALLIQDGAGPEDESTAQDETESEDLGRAPGAEGPLQNDTFVPRDEAAEAALHEGDRALARSRSSAREDTSRRARLEAFQAWQRALEGSEAGAAVAVLEANESGSAARARLFEGVEAGLVRRLSNLAPAELAAWTSFADQTAAPLFERAGFERAATTSALTRRLRGAPATRWAARAALAAGDAALEAGRTQAARAWFERAATHVRLAGSEAAEEASALAVRRDYLARGRPAQADEPAWERGRTLALEEHGFVPLVDDSRFIPRNELQVGAGLRPGAAFFADGSVVVQTPRLLRLLRTEPGGGLVQARVTVLDDLLRSAFDPPGYRNAFPDGPAWPLRPAVAGSFVALVHGADYDGPNALCVLRVADEEPRDRLALTTAIPSGFELVWAVSGDRFGASGGAFRLVDELAPLADGEFQPGPVVVEDRVLAQVRLYDPRGLDVRSWLVAFELASGRLLWSRYLAKGSDFERETSRFRSSGAGERLAAQPLTSSGSTVLVGTNLGLVAAVDALDGRILWKLRTRRRPGHVDGWTGREPLPVLGTEDELTVAPFDSDRLYRLRARAAIGPDPLADILAAPPLPSGSAQALVGGDADEVLVLARAGAERTLLALRAGERREALYLAPGETFSGHALTGAKRALAATDRGLYLFDRERDLFLLDVASLPRPRTLSGAPRGGSGVPRVGGDVLARGQRVLVVGPLGMWIFKCLP